MVVCSLRKIRDASNASLPCFEFVLFFLLLFIDERFTIATAIGIVSQIVNTHIRLKRDESARQHAECATLARVTILNFRPVFIVHDLSHCACVQY